MVTVRAMLVFVGLSLLNFFGVSANSDQICDATDGEGRCLPVASDHQTQQSLLQKTFAHTAAAHAPKEHQTKHHSNKNEEKKEADVAERSHDAKFIDSHHTKKETKVATARKKSKEGVGKDEESKKTVKKKSRSKVQKANGVHHARRISKRSSKLVKTARTSSLVAESTLPVKRCRHGQE